MTVECYAGFAYPERPTAFTWEGERLEVEALLAERRTPEGKSFRVRVGGGQRLFELAYNEAQDCWTVKAL